VHRRAPWLRPATTARHGGVGTDERDRYDGNAGVRGEVRGAQPEPPGPAVRRSGALREHHQRPALRQQLRRRLGQTDATALDRERREHQRRADRTPPRVEEVVGGGTDGDPTLPLRRQRRQQQRGVEVRRVVRDEDDRTVEVVEYVETFDPKRRLVLHQRAQAAAQDRRTGCDGDA
jgi:hypothetical protein